MPDARYINLAAANLLTIAVGLYPYFHKRTEMTRWFARGNVLMAVWCLNETVAFIPAPHAVVLWLFRLSYILAVFAVWYLFLFGLALADVSVRELPKSWRVFKMMAGINVALACTPWLTADIHERVHPFEEIPGPAYPFFIAFASYFLWLAVYHAVRGYKKSTGHKRTQLKYGLMGVITYLSAAMFFFVGLYYPMGYWYFYLEAAYCAILAYSIVAHQLMDITVIIRKTFEYSLITGILALVYVGVVMASTYLLERVLHMKPGSASVPAVVAVTLLFHPLRLKVQAWVDRKFFRETVNSQKALGDLADQIASGGHVRDIAHALLDALEGTLHPKTLALYLRRLSNITEYQLYSPNESGAWPPALSSEVLNDLIIHSDRQGGPLRAGAGQARAVERVLPLVSASGIVGYLMLGEKRSEAPLDEAEERFLQAALAQAALAYEQALLGPRWAQGNETELLADVARGFVHEIKTPLSNINMPAQATFMDLEAIEGQTRSLETMLPKFKDRLKFIMLQAMKASERIDAIRDFAALGDQHVEPVDLSLIFKACADVLSPLLEQSQVRLVVEAPDTLVLVKANPKHLEIVFGNLIKNAIEAIQSAERPAGERVITASIRSAVAFQEARIQDTGAGIKPEDMPRIFERSFTTKGAAGTGVGLFLTRQLVESLGGTITVTSEEHKGTAFHVRIPRYDPQNPQAFKTA